MGTLGAEHGHRTGILVEHFAVEKQEGAEGLLLGGSGNVPFHG